MAVHKRPNDLQDENDRSPICKRARYDSDVSDPAPWTLSKNELILHSVYDSGVGSLNNSCETALDFRKKMLKPTRRGDKISPSAKLELIAVLEASLPDATVQKLKIGESLISAEEANQNYARINYFDFLSDEVVLHIFQKLTKSQLANIAVVCHRFSQLVEDESLWVRMDCSSKMLPEGVMGKILSRQVIILRLSRARISSPLLFPNVRAAQPNFHCRLMYLDLTMAKIGQPALVDLFKLCKRLKKISLESVPLNDSILATLAGNKDVEVLNLAMCTGIGLEGLRKLLPACRKLRELNLAWTYLSTPCIEYVCDKLPLNLDRFNFSGCRKHLLDRHVTKIVQNCPNIRELDLSDCTAITGESVKKLTNLLALNCLAISRCYMVACRSILHLKRIQSLVYLDVHGNYATPEEHKIVEEGLGSRVNINKFMFSSIARPSVGNKSTIWNMKVRD